MQDDVSRPGASADVDDVQRFMLARAREGIQSGPFSLILSRGDRSLYGNYAIPAIGGRARAASAASIAASIRALAAGLKTK